MEKRDFFISYTHSDEAEAVWIADMLTAHGYKVYIQAWDIKEAENFVQKMEEFLDNSASFIAVWSERYYGSRFAMEEFRAAYATYTMPRHKKLEKFLAIRIEDFPLPTLYRARVHLDFFNAAEEEREKRLLRAVGYYRRNVQPPKLMPGPSASNLPAAEEKPLPVSKAEPPASGLTAVETKRISVLEQPTLEFTSPEEVKLPPVPKPIPAVEKLEALRRSRPPVPAPQEERKRASLPKLTVPKFALPRFSLPKFTLPKPTFPKIVFPKFSLPRFTFHQRLREKLISLWASARNFAARVFSNLKASVPVDEGGEEQEKSTFSVLQKVLISFILVFLILIAFELKTSTFSAMMLLRTGENYQRGAGVEQDYGKAREYYEQAAERGNLTAYWNLAYLYQEGLGVEVDYVKAWKYFQLSVDEDESWLSMLLEILFKSWDYYKPYSDEHHSTAAMPGKVSDKYETDNSASEKNSTENNASGENPTENNELEGLSASQLYQKGWEYQYATDHPDYEKAAEYYRKAAEQKNTDAIIAMGTLYEGGLGVKQNLEQASKYYMWAVVNGDERGIQKLGNLEYVDSLKELAFYGYSEAVKMLDTLGAEQALQELAVRGNFEAMYLMYTSGNVDTLKEIASAGSTDEIRSYALRLLGSAYRMGKGVETNYTKARNYYEDAAALGNLIAISYIGEMYEFGLGEEVNYSSAAWYYQRAIDKGETEYAPECLARVQEKMN